MKKFSDVQQLKSLVDLSATIKSPVFWEFQAGLNDLYEKEFIDFMEKNSAGLVDKLKNILDRNQEGLGEKDVQNRLYPQKTGPEKHVRPVNNPNEQLPLFDEQGNPTYPTKSAPKPFNMPTKEEPGGQMAMDFDAPQQSQLPFGPPSTPKAPQTPQTPGGGNAAPIAPAGPTAPPTIPHGPPSDIGPTAPQAPGVPKIAPQETSPPKPRLSPEDWALISPKIEGLRKALSDYVKYISLNADKFDIAYIKGINEVVKYFNNATKQYVESLRPEERPEAPAPVAPVTPPAPIAPAAPASSEAPTEIVPPASPAPALTPSAPAKKAPRPKKAPIKPVVPVVAEPAAPAAATPEQKVAPVTPSVQPSQPQQPQKPRSKQEVYGDLVNKLIADNKLTEKDIATFTQPGQQGNLLKLIKNIIESTSDTDPKKKEYQDLWHQIITPKETRSKFIPIDLLAPFGKRLILHSF